MKLFESKEILKNKLQLFINKLHTLNIYHSDFFCRNIGIDDNLDFHLIDLCSLTKSADFEQFYSNVFKEIEKNF